MSTPFTPAFDINRAGTTPARAGTTLAGCSPDGRTLTVALDQALPAVSPPGWPPSVPPSPASPTVTPTPSPSPKVWPGRCSAATVRRCRGS